MSYTNPALLFSVLILVTVGNYFNNSLLQLSQAVLMGLHNLDISQYNILFSAANLLPCIFIFWFGNYLDKAGSKALLPCAVVMCLGHVLFCYGAYFPTQNSLQIMLFGRMLIGLCQQMVLVLQYYYTLEYFGQGAIFCLVFSLPELTYVVSGFTVPRMIQGQGLGAALALDMSLCVSCLVFFLILSKYRVQSPEQDKVQWKNVFKLNSQFWYTTIVLVLLQNCLFTYMDNGMELLRELFCLDKVSAGFVVAASYFGMRFVVEFFQGENVKGILATAALVLVSHTYILVFKDCQLIRVAGLLIAINFIGAGVGCNYSWASAKALSSVKKQMRGLACSAISFIESMGLVIFPQTSAMVVKRWGYLGYQIMFTCMALIALFFSFGLKLNMKQRISQEGSAELQTIQM